MRLFCCVIWPPQADVRASLHLYNLLIDSGVGCAQAMKWEREIEARNRPLADEDLDAMMPTEGYRILDPPPGYAPIRTPARKLMGTPTPLGTPGYLIPEEQRHQQFDVPTELEGLPELKPEDMQHFGKLLKDVSALQSSSRLVQLSSSNISMHSP